MLDTKHFERLADDFQKQADVCYEEMNKADNVTEKLRWLTKGNQLMDCMKQLLKTCIKVSQK